MPVASQDPSGHSLDFTLFVVPMGLWPLEADPVSRTASRNHPPLWRGETRLFTTSTKMVFTSIRQVLEKPGRLCKEPRKHASQGTAQDVLKHAFRLGVTPPLASTLLNTRRNSNFIQFNLTIKHIAQGSQRGALVSRLQSRIRSKIWSSAFPTGPPCFSIRPVSSQEASVLFVCILSLSYVQCSLAPFLLTSLWKLWEQQLITQTSFASPDPISTIIWWSRIPSLP